MRIIRTISVASTKIGAFVFIQDEFSNTIQMGMGYSGATSIASVLYDIEHERPMTHDLFVNAINSHVDIKFEKLIITEIIDNTYHAKLVSNKFDLDCRPCDGMALALRLKIPIFVTEKVYQQLEELTNMATLENIEEEPEVLH